MASYLFPRSECSSHINPFGVQVWDSNSIAPKRPNRRDYPYAQLIHDALGIWPMGDGPQGWYPDHGEVWFGPFQTRKEAEFLEIEAKRIFQLWGGPTNQAEADYLGQQIGIEAVEVDPDMRLAVVSWSRQTESGLVLETHVPKGTPGAVPYCLSFGQIRKNTPVVHGSTGTNKVYDYKYQERDDRHNRSRYSEKYLRGSGSREDPFEYASATDISPHYVACDLWVVAWQAMQKDGSKEFFIKVGLFVFKAEANGLLAEDGVLTKLLN